jgi:hypothetical protein
MKKTILKLGVIGMCILGSSSLAGLTAKAQTSPEIWYEIEYSTQVTSSGLYLVTKCTNIPGSACNMPGSVHRSDISSILSIIQP